MNYFDLPWLAKVRFLIFDLDGTLYQDLEFHRELCDRALSGTPYEPMIPEVVDLVDRILEGDPDNRMPDFVYLRRFEGIVDPTDGGGLAAAFAAAPCTPMDTLSLADHAGDDPVSLADGWSVSFAVLRLLGIPNEARKSAFYEVRSSMLARLCRHDVLTAALRSATPYKILQTNSPEDTGTEFIEALLESESFREIHCDAGKPRGIHHLITGLIDAGALPQEILSIGDHPWNDLKPARDLGCRTVLISPYAGMPNGRWDLRLHTLEELADLTRAASGDQHQAVGTATRSLHE